MKALKLFFMSRLMREKILLLVFLLMAVVIWLSSFARRTSDFASAFSTASEELNTHALWLGRSAQIDEAANKAVSRLDPAKTLDGIKLSAAINRMAAESGLQNVVLDDHRDERSAQFSLHTVRLTARRADYATLIKFYQAVQACAPYIGIEQFVLNAETSNPAQLNASLRLSSVEVIKEGT